MKAKCSQAGSKKAVQQRLRGGSLHLPLNRGTVSSLSHTPEQRQQQQAAERISSRQRNARPVASMSKTFRFIVAVGLLVVVCAPGVAQGKRSRERVYYVGIIEDTWDYAPSGKNLLNGKNIADDE